MMEMHIQWMILIYCAILFLLSFEILFKIKLLLKGKEFRTFELAIIIVITLEISVIIHNYIISLSNTCYV